MTPNGFFILKIIYRRKFYKIFYHPTKVSDVSFVSLFSFFKDQFCCGIVKQKNFLHVVDLSFKFDTRFVKHYPFSFHYHKQCPINNNRVKCSQIGQNVPDILWICSLQIVSDKTERIADFNVLVMWLWFLVTTENLTNEWKLINL